ncbi:MAG: hypothetical protein LBU65_14250 [Planctomycetaceae bacterium]|jgi:protocatechuate 3,4-dioxygenase beta subunit|nr:hypothetical protein [Planctomycetaceae bacterium]
MGIFSFFGTKKNVVSSKFATRVCQFEQLESRELLSINPLSPPPEINVGIVFVENYNPSAGHSNDGDLFTVTWNGGADGTTLDRLEIDTSTAAGQVFFSILGNFVGDYNNFAPFAIFQNDGGIGVSVGGVEDGGTLLILNFTNFTAGKTLVFSIDVNEYTTDSLITDIVDGKELEGTTVRTTFSADDYESEVIEQQFLNKYTIIEELADELPPDGNGITNHSLMAGTSVSGLQENPLKGSISGHVYEDNNNDGVFDQNEAGVFGVELKLQVWDAVNNCYVDVDGAVTTTNASGFYEFNNLDVMKHYRIVETQPANYVSGKNTAGTLNGVADDANDSIDDIPLQANQHGENYNFGELQKASLSGYVYEDNNNDGNRDNGESGIANVKLGLYVLTENGYELVSYATTNEDGYYSFNNLDPLKTYKIIEEQQPSGYYSGKNTKGTLGGDASDFDDWITSIPLGIGQSGEEYNFGELNKTLFAGSLSGHVYVDRNNNGVREDGEEGIGNVTLTLWVQKSDGTYEAIRTQITDIDGYYIFSGLDPYKIYKITEVQPTGYDDGLDTHGSLGGTAVNPGDEIYGISVGLAEHGTGYDFGELEKDTPPTDKPGSISGAVYLDANKNGLRDTGEVGIENVKLTLYKWNGSSYVKIAETFSGVNGEYSFTNLDPNLFYEVRETQPAGYNDGSETVGSLKGTLDANDVISDIYVRSDEHGTGYNFGELTAIDISDGDGSISGHVYEDDNDNGFKENGEQGIPNVKLQLCQWDDELEEFVLTTRTATTDENGYYSFDNLPPGIYCVTEIRDNIDDYYCDGKDHVGSLGGKLSTEASRIYEIPVDEKDAGADYDFGELRRGYLSGYVYVDANGNGSRDSGEKGISGVTLSLWVWDVATQSYIKTSKTTVTDADGYYIFAGLCPSKKYRIVETQPAAYDDGDETVGSLNGNRYASPADIIDEIEMPVAGKGENYNFGELVKMVTPPPPPPITMVTPPSPPSLGLLPAGGAAGGYAAPAPLAWSPAVQAGLMPGYGGGGLAPVSYSWHLSVINGGHPRELNVTGEDAAAIADTGSANVLSARLINVAWNPNLDDNVWFVRDKFGRITQRFRFGNAGAKPIVGDFNGDGIDEIAVFHNGNWYIDINGNGVWDEEDLICNLGTADDQPLVGDWDNDGKADIGIFGPRWTGDERAIAEDPGLPSDLNGRTTARAKSAPPHGEEAAVGKRSMKHTKRGGVRYDVIDHVFQYGGKGDVAVAGDFNGDGVTEIGVYRNGNWYIDFNGDGRWDPSVDKFIPGEAVEGAVPVVGDWNGEGIDRIGLFVNGQWKLDTTGDFQYDKTIEFGQAGDVPVVGDFSGDGISELAIYRPQTQSPLLTQNNTLRSVTPEPFVAQQFNPDAEATLPENLMSRPGRTIATPYTSTAVDGQ